MSNCKPLPGKAEEGKRFDATHQINPAGLMTNNLDRQVQTPLTGFPKSDRLSSLTT